MAKYSLNINNLKDIYWWIINNYDEKNFETESLKDIDKYVYLSFNNDINVFPKHLPKVINIQSINTDKAKINICQMSDKNYFSYLSKRYEDNFVKKCDKLDSKILDTKLTYWFLSNNKFDLEQDILWDKLTYNHVFIDIFSSLDERKDLSYDSKIISQTNVSLLVEKASNKSLLFATDIQNNQIVSDLKLSFYTSDLKEVWVKYNYDKNKKLYILDTDLTSISYIVASNNIYYWVISESDNFSNYDFKYVSWQDSSTREYAYIYTDRPIYRSKDEVFIKWIIKKFDFDWYKKVDFKEATLDIYDDKNIFYRSEKVKIDKNSNFNLSFTIPEDSVLWNFTFKLSKNSTDYKDIYSSDYLFTYWWFSIEEYKKPIFKVNISWNKTWYNSWEKASFKINSKYYFGWNMSKSEWKYSVLTQKYFFDAKEYNDYSFWAWYEYFDCVYWGYCNYHDELIVWEKGFLTDDNWEYNYDYSFWDKQEDSEKIYTFNFEIEDKDTSKKVSNSVSTVLHTTSWYVWLKTKYYNSSKDWIYSEFITLDTNAKILPNTQIEVKVYKKDYKNVKKMWVDWVFYNEYYEDLVLEDTVSLKTWNDWTIKYNFKTKSTWEYQITASYTWKNNKTFSSTNYVYVAWDDYISWWNDNNSITEISSDKINYLLWEKANLIVKSPVNNWKILYILEKDDWIIDYFVKDISDYSPKFDFEIQDKHFPNVYIKTFLIWNKSWNPLPVYKRALQVVKVFTDYKKLQVIITPLKTNYLPWEKMSIQIQVLDNLWQKVKNANWSISVVDQSVLALKWNPKKNPYAFFYDMKRYLWVETFSNLKFLIEKLEIKDTSDWEKWWAWDMVKWWDTKKLRWNFKDTAFWQSDFVTDANWIAKIDIPVLPDNLTTWVIEVLVNDEKHRVWINYETFTTSKPLMIEDNLPSFVYTDDKISFSPVIYNKTWKDQEIDLSLEVNNWSIKQISKKEFLKSWESKKVIFEYNSILSSSFQENTALNITIKAKTKTWFEDSILKIIPIKLRATKETTTTVWSTKNNSFDEKIDLTKETLLPILKINYSSTLFTYLLDSFDFLSNYPYWCFEQQTSAIMPSVYLKELYEVSWREYDLTKKFIKKYVDNNVWYIDVSVDSSIKDYLSKLQKFQNTDWWFKYWSDISDEKSNLELTIYWFSSLSKISSLWYKIDQTILKNTKTYLLEKLKKPTCNNYNTSSCLAETEKLSIINSLYDFDNQNKELYDYFENISSKKVDNINYLYSLSKFINVSYLSDKIKKDLLKQALSKLDFIISNELVITPKWAYINWYSKIEKTSLLLAIIWQIWVENIDSKEILDNIIRFISENSKNLSTYESSILIKNIVSYLYSTNELKDTNLVSKVILNNKTIDSKKIDNSNIFDTHTFKIDSLQKNNIFNISKTWNWKLYYDLSLDYFIKSQDIKSRDEWFFVEKKYFSYNEYKKIESLKQEEYNSYLSWSIKYNDLKYPKDVVYYLKEITDFKVWDLVLVYNKIITSEDRQKVFFESYIPSWSQILNTSLATESKTISFPKWNIFFEREELRDDRYFWYIENLYTWVYENFYLLKITHSWDFQVPPTKIWEFYNTEVFGRSNWKNILVK